MPEGRELAEDDELAAAFEVLLRYKELAGPPLEDFRSQKNRSEDARLLVTPTQQDAAVLKKHQMTFSELCIVSQVQLQEPAETASIAVEPAAGERCERCWRWYEAMSSVADLCGRCHSALG
jgi:isoleucyl-tRNA synthetase